MPRNNDKIIAKNTLFRSFRMMFTMVISLYTSRVILQALGVDDFGVYQAVGGIVGFMSFLNSAFASGSSRFLTYAMGEGNFEKLKRTFSTNLFIHVVIGLVVVLLAEILGTWYLEHKMVISEERFFAAKCVFHISVFTAFINITQVPYNAAIMAHEKMSVYAYTSIVEVLLKLAICYMLYIGSFDKLIMYAVLLCVIHVGVMLFYRFYCMKNFAETKTRLSLDKSLVKQIGAFSGWSFVASTSIALNSQGILLLLNMFFSPAVVAARAISLQVNSAANQFVNSFRAAANPQITKRYAAGDKEGSKKLLLQSTIFSYYLMLMMALPIVFSAKPLLELWLSIVPEYTVIFLQLIVIQSLCQVFDTSFYQALYAKGQIKENAMISPSLGLIRFPLTYLLFRCGFSPVALSWLSILNYALLGFLIKPVLLVKICEYEVKDILKVFAPCIRVTIFACLLPFLLKIICETYGRTFSNVEHLLLFSMVSLLGVLGSVWILGLDKSMREKFLIIVKRRLKK